MIKKSLSPAGFSLAAGIAIVLVAAGCATSTAAGRVGQESVVAAPPAGIVLAYKMPAGRVLRYIQTDEVKETSDRMGQILEGTRVGTGTDAFRSKGLKDGHFLLEVTIEDMAMTSNGAQGESKLDTASVVGKSFEMILSSSGAEIDVSGAEPIKFTTPNGPRSVASAYKTFFPDLPGKPVKVGDAWPTDYTVEDASGPLAFRTDYHRVHTLEGFESVAGMDCARIVTAITGRVSGGGNTQGTEIRISGEIKGTAVWHFAPKEGLYVQSTSDVVNEMTVTVTRGQTMTMPTTQKQKSTVTLTGR
jgi:hypothetical protein